MILLVEVEVGLLVRELNDDVGSRRVEDPCALPVIESLLLVADG